MTRTGWAGAVLVLMVAGCGSATVKQGSNGGGHGGASQSTGAAGSAGAAGSSGAAGSAGAAGTHATGTGVAGMGAAGMGGGGMAAVNGVSMRAPTVVVSGNDITVSGLISWSAPITFADRQIAVRPPAGSAGMAFSTAFSPGAYAAAGSTTLEGTGTCNVPGDWTAFETYALVDNPAQSDWIDGPSVSFTIGAATAGTGGGGGTTAAAGIKLGFSVNGIADGSLAAWLTHHTMDCAGTWNDNAAETQTAQYSIQPSGDFGAWNRCLDLAVGGIFQRQGESWASAAAGAYDDRWRTAVSAIKSAWGTRDPALLNIRFAHEFNLKDSNWRVTGDDADNFKKAWGGFHDILKAALPSASLVWCPNDGTSSLLNLDVRNSYPGNDQVDIIAIDTYNQYPWVNNAADFMTKINGLGSDGAPLGAESWRKFAAAQGKPFAIGEWASNGDVSGGNGGDSPSYIQLFHDWLVANGGTGPGQIKYAVFFNGYTQFEIYPDTIQSNARDKVRQLF